MFGGGLPGLLAGLGAFSFGGLHLFSVPSHGVSVVWTNHRWPCRAG